MRQLLLIIILIIGSVASFTGYYAMLTDWIQDLSSGLYTNNRLEATLETTALFLYTYMAVRFMRSKLNA